LSEYIDRLKKLESNDDTINTLVEIIELEERNITYKRPPRIVEQVMEIVDKVVEKEN
jgi:hypothetical protein